MSNEFDENFECSPENCASCAGCDSLEDGFPSTISLTMEDDSVVECAVLSIYPVDGKLYIALVPLDEEGEVSANEVYLYAFHQADDGSPVLSNIEDDEEYERASQGFDAIMEEAVTVADSEEL